MITSTLGRMASADKLSVQQLKQAVQDGTVPAYIGIPLLQEKMKQSQQAIASQAGQAPQQPPIADQIMQQAAGVPALQSNLPAQYAHGGVIHLAGGGYDPMAMARAYTHDEEDPEDMDFLNALGADQMPETQEPDEELETQGIQSDSGGISNLTPAGTLAYAAPFSTTRQADQVTVKQEGEPAQTVRKETARVERPAAARDLERLALAEGEKYKLDPSLIKHVMFKETGNLKDKANAVSPAGAGGVMQLMPATAREMGVKDVFDPVQNIEGGVKYLAMMKDKYGDPKLAAIAYNWGPGRTDRWLAQGGDFAKLPKETQGYIRGMASGGRPKDEFDEDTDDRTVDLNGLGQDQTAAFDINQISNTAPNDTSSNWLDTLLPPLEGGKPNPLREALRTRQFKSDPDSVEAEGVTYNVATPKPLTEEDKKAKAEAKAETQHIKELYPKPPPYSRSEAATKESPQITQPAPLAPESIGGPRSIATDASEQEVRDALNEQPKPAAAPAEVKDTGYSDLKDYFTKGIAGLADQKKINAYLALLSGGLGMMGGTSPYAMTNIGQGAQAGVQTYMAGNKDIAAQQAAMMQGRLGLEKYASLRDIQKGQAANLLAYHNAEAERKTEAAKMRDITAREAIQSRNLQVAQRIVAKMETDAAAGARAQVTQMLKSPVNMGKTPEEQQDLYARAEEMARARLNQHPYYRKLHEVITPGYDPGQLQVGPEINDLVTKYMQPKK